MKQRVIPFFISAAVVLLDRLTKEAIKSHFSAWDSLAVIPGFFNIVHTENPGIAFGLLADVSNPWRDVLLIGFSLAVLLVISAILVYTDRFCAPAWRSSCEAPSGIFTIGLCTKP
jgi:signal peptidase II